MTEKKLRDGWWLDQNGKVKTAHGLCKEHKTPEPCIFCKKIGNQK